MPGLTKVLLLTTGAESNEAALRMAKMVTDGWEVVGFAQSWHGMTAAAARRRTRPAGAATALPVGSMAVFAPNAYRPRFRRDGSLDWRGELDDAFDLVDRQSAGDPAAFMAEPVLSSGGILDLPPGYLAAFRRAASSGGCCSCSTRPRPGSGVLARCSPSSATASCRTSSRCPRRSAPALPLAAVLTTDEIEEQAHERGFLFYTTHVSDPLPAAVGLKVIEIVLRDRLAARAAEAGARLIGGLGELRDRYECVGDVRGRGLLVGVEIVADKETKKPAPDLGAAITRRCFELGLSMNIVALRGMGGVFRIAPPLTITDDELDRGIAILDQAIADVAG